MNFISTETDDGIATVTLARGKVNPLNGEVIEELHRTFKRLETDPGTRAVILTGRGSFFSFGFDLPEFVSFSRDAFTDFLIRFADLYTYLFLYPKPLVGALNGHTIAGGCMLALACDHRIMARGRGKISLNEVTFGASVFAGATEMLRFASGSANATEILYSGAMYPAEEALGLGLIHGMSDAAELMPKTREIASDLASKYGPAFAGIKSLLRRPVADSMVPRERASIDAFVEIWYSDHTWKNIGQIGIR